MCACAQELRKCEEQLLSPAALREMATQMRAREARLQAQAVSVAVGRAQQAMYVAHQQELARVLREAEEKATVERRQAVARAVEEAKHQAALASPLSPAAAASVLAAKKVAEQGAAAGAWVDAD